MASGVGAAIGIRRCMIACIACVAAYGLYAGWWLTWIMLLTDIGYAATVARMAAIWAVLVAVFWLSTRDVADWCCMAICMLFASALICLLIHITALAEVPGG